MQVTGEATPGYLFCITCPTYILKYMPRVRVLFTLRNPVVRQPLEAPLSPLRGPSRTLDD